MLSRRLPKVSPWRRNYVCLFCAVQGQIQPQPCRPFSATPTLFQPPVKAPGDEVRKPSVNRRKPKRAAGNEPKSTRRSSKPPSDGFTITRVASGPQDEEPAEREEEGLMDESQDQLTPRSKRTRKTEEPQSLKHALLGDTKAREKRETRARDKLAIKTLYSDSLHFKPVEADKPPIPMLSYGLDRVLFNSGVYRLQDPRSGVYNFDPYLEKIMPVNEFDFEALSEYKTSSKDEELLALTRRIGSKFTGSTSSMSAILQHFHYVLSNFRKVNHDMLSREFPEPSGKFSRITLGPSAIFLRHKDGVYAIDADKTFDSPNIMSWLGHSLEKILTTDRSEFERFRRSNPEKAPAEDNSGRCYHYSQQGKVMMRSQLDAVDPRLPGTGVFDLKTRAVISIRMNHKEYEVGSGYQLRHHLGEWESFEREFYDMTRATLLKYSLQVRMGRMDGIFLAYHNIERIFGFQYLSLADMDAVLHGQRNARLGDDEFKFSIGLVEELLTKATTMFPDTSIRLHFEAREANTPFMYVFAEPVTEEQADEIQNAGEAAQKEFARTVVGLGKDHATSQAAWHDIQDDVDEQVGVDEGSPSVPENPEVTAKQGELATPSEVAPIETTEALPTNESPETAATTDGSSEADAIPKGPLMGWTLTVRSLVNGGYVDRPEQLHDGDEWKVEYHIKDIAEDRRWKLYSAVKERRRQLVGLDEEELDKNLRHYRGQIQRYSKRGREWRKEQDALNEAKGVQLFRPLGPGSEPVESMSQEKKEEVLEDLPASPS